MKNLNPVHLNNEINRVCDEFGNNEARIIQACVNLGLPHQTGWYAAALEIALINLRGRSPLSWTEVEA